MLHLRGPRLGCQRVPENGLERAPEWADLPDLRLQTGELETRVIAPTRAINAIRRRNAVNLRIRHSSSGFFWLLR